MHARQHFLSLVLAVAVAGKTTTTIDGIDYICKCYKGDACWPSDATWSQLNSTVNGTLHTVTPIGKPCFRSYDGRSTYDEAQCNETTTNNQVAAWVVKESTQIMYEYYSNNTCDPGLGQQNRTCTQGYYPDYVIKASIKEHIVAGVNFARDNNVRLVIRNTGHDFLGRSIGRGSLTINTQSFQDITFIDKYTGPGDWNGSAVTVGAGVLFRDLYPKAFQRKVVVVGGECATVGIAGGYIQGGGHGPLSGYLGLAVDNVLSFDVVLASGEFVQANANDNQELFWALRGGGPSTFGVVTSVTLKTHPEIPSIAMTMTITGPDSTFWKGVYHFRSFQNAFSQAGLYVWYGITPGNILNIQPFVAPNFTRADFDKLVQPFVTALSKDNVTFTSQIQEFKTFYELYNTTFEKSHDAGAQQSLLGGRIIVRDDISTPAQANNLTSAIRSILASGSIFAGHIINPGSSLSPVKNSTTAAHPSWYQASSQDVFFLPVAKTLTAQERKAAEDKVTWDLGKTLRDATPNSASYINEGDANEPYWQSTYWANQYELLWKLKRILDPNGVFYAKTTPGTEDWKEFDGKLCKKAENSS